MQARTLTSRARRRGRRRPSMIRRATSPMRTRPALITGLEASGPPDGLIVGVAVRGRAPRARISSSWLNCACSSATSIVPSAAPAVCAGRGSSTPTARGRARRGACASMRCSMPADPRRALAHRAGEVARRDHDRRRAVGDRRDVGVAQRVVRHRLREQLVGGHVALADRVRVRLRRCAARAPRPRRDRASVAAARLEVRARLQRGHVDHRRPQRHDVVRVGLQRHDLVQVTGRRLAEAVDERAVDLAGLDRDPRLVQRPRRVHLDVALPDRRPRADRVEARHERERPALEVVEAARARRSRCRPSAIPDSSIAACTVGHEHLGLVVLGRHARPRTARSETTATSRISR